MNIFKKTILAASCAAALGLGAGTAMAQPNNGNDGPGGPGGRFAQFRERMMDRIREQMDVKDDAEWSAIQTKITAVFDAQREAMGNRFGGAFGGRRNRGGNSNNNNGDQAQPRRGGFGLEPSPEAEALQKALDDKSSTSAEIKSKLAALRAVNKAKEAKLEKAQDDLKGILTRRQEAVAVLNGLLK